MAGGSNALPHDVEARSLKSRHQHGCALSRVQGRALTCPFWLLGAPGVPGLATASSGLCLCLHMAKLSLSLCPPFLQGGFPGGSAGKESACNVGDLSSVPGLGRSPAEGKGNPLQFSGLENSMDYVVHGIAKSWTRLSDFHFLRS